MDNTLKLLLIFHIICFSFAQLHTHYIVHQNLQKAFACEVSLSQAKISSYYITQTIHFIT